MPWSFSVQCDAAESAHAIEEPAGVVVDVVELVGKPERGAEQLAVDVDLQLVPGAVAHSHRRAALPPLEVRKGALGQVVLAADAEHDLQAVVGSDRGGRRRGEEGEEVVCLVRTGSDPERLHREARVAHPGVAVVPVALSADALGKRGRRGGDDRAAGLERQALEYDAAVVHEVCPRSVVGLVQV